MPTPPEIVATKLAHLPDEPGVYLWKGEDGTVLYVGKAKSLRSRVRSYFGSGDGSVKTWALVRLIADLDTIVVPSESHALILEANLIKEYRPRFNIVLRDDKSYPFVKVTLQEPYPRVLVTRRLLDDGARYFGPYTDVGAMRRALNVVKRTFTVRSCNYDMPAVMPERPCLDYHIGRCKAPCILAQTQEEYRAMIDDVVLFLEGRAGEVQRRVRQRMESASAALDFETAAELRDVLRHLDRMEEPTVIVQVDGGDRDVIGFARDGDDVCLVTLRMRDGKLVARDQRFVDHAVDASEQAILAAFLTAEYLSNQERVGEILAPFSYDDAELIDQTIRPSRILVPQRGPKRELVDLAVQNARHLLEELKLSSLETDERAGSPVYDLQRELGLPSVPRAICCFDISTAQGTDTVGSVVWFENGRARRSEYRKLKVKSVEGVDDFASMREVVERYFRRRIDEERPLPDLVVIDGGKGQLGVAHEALTNAGLATLPLISLAKRDEEVFVVGRSESVRLSRRSPALRLLQQARDEAHRVAVTYNRKRRSMRTIASALSAVPGIGPARRIALLRRFGSVEGVRAATAEEIARLPGFSLTSAQRLLAALGTAGQGETPEADEPPAG